jgi:hypothetical protein
MQAQLTWCIVPPCKQSAQHRTQWFSRANPTHQYSFVPYPSFVGGKFSSTLDGISSIRCAM